MKMVKSLLLGSAAGLVAAAGAQAADLPVKAKPVEYVKVCSLYGAGFYYIPGTDICMKIGGYVRAEWGYGNIGASMTNLENTGLDGQRTRMTGPDYNQRARTVLTADHRQQTAYGTLRSYMNIGFSFDITNARPATGVYANRAFLQIAGFTMGLATSFYDFYSSPATSYSVPWSSDTGDGGYKVFAYTAQFGNGVSATLSAEEPRRTSVVNTSFSQAFSFVIPGTTGLVTGTSNIPFLVGSLPTPDQVKVRYPDLVANLRVDQVWGSAQIMGALHDASGGYYGINLNGTQGSGHPADVNGWAVGVGAKINTPFISPGDYFQTQVNFTRGATSYAANTPTGAGSPGIFTGGNSLGVGWFTDGVFCGSAAGGVPNGVGCPGGVGPSSVELTTALSFQAAYEHFWTPALRTSIVYGYTKISYSAAASAMMCTSMFSAGNVAPAVPNGNPLLAGNQFGALTGITNCGAGSFDWSHWSLSSRTQWNITKDFYIGLEGYYARLQTMSPGQTAVFTQVLGSGQPSGLRTLQDQSVWVGRFRVHRDIVP